MTRPSQSDMTGRPRLRVRNVAKTFTMHLQGGARLPVVTDVTFDVAAGECVVLGGPSGIGKSSILKMIFGNYLADTGAIELLGPDGYVDVVAAGPRAVLKLRQTTIAYVSQFLRAIPRVSALDLVATAAAGGATSDARHTARARDLLARLNVPEALWLLPPATFSGGEQQRINIARGFAADRPLMLLDEPTASLDAANRAVVVDLIRERKASGAALLGIFHDRDVRDAVADRIIDVTEFQPGSAAA